MILDDDLTITSQVREVANFERKLLKYIKSQMGTFYHSSLSSYSTLKKERFPEELYVLNGNDYFKVCLGVIGQFMVLDSFGVRDGVNNYKFKNYNNEHKAISQYYFEQIMKEIENRGWSYDIKTIKIKFNL